MESDTYCGASQYFLTQRYEYDHTVIEERKPQFVLQKTEFVRDSIYIVRNKPHCSAEAHVSKTLDGKVL